MLSKNKKNFDGFASNFHEESNEIFTFGLSLFVLAVFVNICKKYYIFSCFFAYLDFLVQLLENEDFLGTFWGKITAKAAFCKNLPRGAPSRAPRRRGL